MRREKHAHNSESAGPAAKPTPKKVPRKRGGVSTFFVFSAAAVAAALGYAGYRFSRGDPEVAAPRSELSAGASVRLSAPSPTEADVQDACEAVRHLWSGLTCAEILRDHWEQAPLLSRPGAEWNQRLMRLGDVSKMVGSWPVKFLKNHATASMHRPGSGFLADERWKYGDPVPRDAVELALREERTLVMHNLEVYWPPVGELIRQVVRYFHAYTQVNLYVSPAALGVATAPHQEHSIAYSA
jgi:hypothetical protein